MTQTQYTPGPWEPSNSITHWHNRSRPEDDRKDMMDYSSIISCIAPFKENEHGGFEECETQSVAKAFGRTKEECLANARLIAAAPETAAERDSLQILAGDRLIEIQKLTEINTELLEALKTFVTDFDESRAQFNGQPLQIRNSTYDAAKAVIAKATGAP